MYLEEVNYLRQKTINKWHLCICASVQTVPLLLKRPMYHLDFVSSDRSSTPDDVLLYMFIYKLGLAMLLIFYAHRCACDETHETHLFTIFLLPFLTHFQFLRPRWPIYTTGGWNKIRKKNRVKLTKIWLSKGVSLRPKMQINVDFNPHASELHPYIYMCIIRMKRIEPD